MVSYFESNLNLNIGELKFACVNKLSQLLLLFIVAIARVGTTRPYESTLHKES